MSETLIYLAVKELIFREGRCWTGEPRGDCNWGFKSPSQLRGHRLPGAVYFGTDDALG
jgi:hypothetical protein